MLKETALSVLNYKKAKYRKEKNIIQQVLNVTKMPDVKSICSSIRVANNKELEDKATRILREYKENNDLTVSHPQYDAMAVYQTSKLMKIKVSEEKLIEVSHLKRMQWTLLKTTWNRWFEENKIKLEANVNKRNAENGIKLLIGRNIRR